MSEEIIIALRSQIKELAAYADLDMEVIATLKQRLKDYEENARLNEKIVLRMQQMELRLIATSSFTELVNLCLDELKQFFNLDAVSLALIDTDYEIQRILYELGINLDDYPNLLFFQNHAELNRLIQAADKPQLGPYVTPWHQPLLRQDSSVLVRIAILPLIRRQTLIGCLNMASSNEQRFTTDMGTDFIARLGATVAICLENVVNSEKLRHIGLTDPLTGVHNRRYFDERLREEVDRQQRQGNNLSCLFLDIDHFKHINDNYGHQAGDVVLREVANRIKALLRVSDTLGRYGGEEFAVLLVQTDENTARSVAERIRASIGDVLCPISIEQGIRVTISIGVATLRSNETNGTRDELASTLLASADAALYRSKAAGRNRVTVFQ